MKTASIDEKKLKQLTRRLRTLSTIPLKVRAELVNALLKECDIIRRTDVENLVCTTHAKTLSGYKSKESLFRLARSGVLRTYSPCHRGYGCLYDRRELLRIAQAPRRKGGKWSRGEIMNPRDPL